MTTQTVVRTSSRTSSEIREGAYQYQKFQQYPRLSQDLQKKLKLTDSQADNLRIFDAKDDLVLIHYITEDYNNVPLDVQDWRGVVVNSTTGKTVAKSFPFTKEYSTSDLRDNTVVSEDVLYPGEIYAFSEAYEGTVIRIFGGNFCTHHYIDGRTSRWAPIIVKDETNEKGFRFTNPRSFYEIFTSIVGEDFIETLNPEWCYVVLLSTNENRIVVNTPNKLVLLDVLAPAPQNIKNVFTEDLYSYVETANLFHDTEIIHPKVVKMTREQLLERLQKEENENLSAGYVVSSCSGMYKFITDKYAYYRKVRGNEPNIIIRYLSLSIQDKQILREIYPEYSCAFDYTDSVLSLLVEYLKNVYIVRYVNKAYLWCPPPIHHFVSRLPFTCVDVEAMVQNRLTTCSGKDLYNYINNMPPQQKSEEVVEVVQDEKYRLYSTVPLGKPQTPQELPSVEFVNESPFDTPEKKALKKTLKQLATSFQTQQTPETQRAITSTMEQLTQSGVSLAHCLEITRRVLSPNSHPINTSIPDSYFENLDESPTEEEHTVNRATPL